MDVRHLKAFLAVFEERNITAAAQRLFISQPTLSVTIKQLEEELGATLFVRQPRGVEVSAEARLLYPQARRMVAESEAMSRMFRGREDRVALTLGIEGDIAARHIEAFVRMARQALPNLLLTLEEGCHGDGRLAVEEMCCEDELFLPLWEESYVMALPVDHPMATAGSGWAPIEDWITCPQTSVAPAVDGVVWTLAGGGGGACRVVAAGAAHGRGGGWRGDVAAVAGARADAGGGTRVALAGTDPTGRLVLRGAGAGVAGAAQFA